MKNIHNRLPEWRIYAQPNFFNQTVAACAIMNVLLPNTKINLLILDGRNWRFTRCPCSQKINFFFV